MRHRLGAILAWVRTNIVTPVRRMYPTRQVYFRANGRVRFLSLSPAAQMSASVLAMGALLWVGVATFNFVFLEDILDAKDQELAAKDRALEELNEDMAYLEGDLQQTVKAVRAKQRYLETLIDSTPALEVTPADPEAAPEQQSALPFDPESDFAQGGPEFPMAEDDPELLAENEMEAPEPPPWFAFKTWVSDLISPEPADTDAHRSARIKAMAVQVFDMHAVQQLLTGRMLQRTEKQVQTIREAFTTAGLDADAVFSARDATANQGGPLEVISDDERLLLEAEADEAFRTLMARQETLGDYRRILESFPVVKPLKDYYYVSSSYGVRRDPFTKARAMHGGLDMASHWKTPIYATAPGVVVKAGRNGAYGRMIEIDHGNGFKTRYGHLHTILVEKGQQITEGEQIALMGNTGRSTGTHLHYEIRFLDKPYNPVKFFKAEKHVFIEPEHSEDHQHATTGEG